MRITGSILALALVAQGIAGAQAQDGAVTVAGAGGLDTVVSDTALYRALGDRIVTGGDVIGNNVRRWSQVDPQFSDASITGFDPQGRSETDLVAAIRAGCRDATGNSAQCARVGLRRDLGNVAYGTFQPPGSTTPTMTTGGATMQPIEDRTESVTTSRPPSPPLPVWNPSKMVPAMTSSLAPPVPAPVQAAPVKAAATPVMTRDEPVFATRLFTGRDDDSASFPPEDVAAYGIIAFNTRAIGDDRARYLAICEAFFGVLLDSGSSGFAIDKQMVTVWPVDDRTQPGLTDELNTVAERGGSCEKAVEYYDLQIARGAIGEARRANVDLSGRGPFLLAWAPGAMKGRPDAIVLAADMGDVTTATEAKEVLKIWRDDIERDPALWAEDGFSVEKLRVKLRLIADRYGDGLLKFLGG